MSPIWSVDPALVGIVVVAFSLWVWVILPKLLLIAIEVGVRRYRQNDEIPKIFSLLSTSCRVSLGALIRFSIWPRGP